MHIDKIETRGKPLKCRYCEKNFKIDNVKDKQTWRENKCICPLCGEEWCTLPLTERDLKYLQETYLKDRSEENFIPFLRLLYRYCQSLIKKNYSNKLTFEDALIYYTNEAITFTAEEYLNRPDFKIDISFAGYLLWKIKQTIFNPDDFIDVHTSLDFVLEDGNNLHAVLTDGNVKDVIANIELEEDTNLLYEKIVYIIEGIKDYCSSSYEDHIRIISVYSYLKKGQIAFDKLFQSFGREDGKVISQKTLDFLREELQKELITYDDSYVKETAPLPSLRSNMILNINNLNGIHW